MAKAPTMKQIRVYLIDRTAEVYPHLPADAKGERHFDHQTLGQKVLP
jgi:hypothetical protein